METTVESLEQADGRVVAFTTADGERQIVHGDVVVCAGCESPKLAKTVGVHVPLYPMKGPQRVGEIEWIRENQRVSELGWVASKRAQ